MEKLSGVEMARKGGMPFERQSAFLLHFLLQTKIPKYHRKTSGKKTGDIDSLYVPPGDAENV